MSRRLRVAHVLVTPVLVWDDGEELSPGPTAQATALPLSAMPGLPDQLREEVEAMAAQIAEQEATQADA